METKRQKGQNVLPVIHHQGHLYRIENGRDFLRKTEGDADEHFFVEEKNINNIVGCSLYQAYFGFHDIFSHYMVGFHFVDGTEIIVSIEARRPKGSAYHLRKGIIPGMYDIIYIWGTRADLLGIRTDIRKEKVYQFSFLLDTQQAQTMWRYFVHRTNTLPHQPKGYSALRYNCISDIHAALTLIHPHLPQKTRWTIFSRGYARFCARYGLISL